jgi:UDP-glucose/GDP-mannose dehydrogenase family, UDP binding domain
LLPEGVRYYRTAVEAANGASAAVIVTEWDEFRHLDLVRLKRKMASPVLVDLRNMLSEEQVARKGFRYCAIGNGASPSRDRAVEARIWKKRDAEGYRSAATSKRSSISLNQKIVAAE